MSVCWVATLRLRSRGVEADVGRVERGRPVRSSSVASPGVLLVLLLGAEGSAKGDEEARIVARFSHCASRCALAYLLPSSAAPLTWMEGTETESGAAGRFSGKCELVAASCDFDRERPPPPPMCSRSDSLLSCFGRMANVFAPFVSSESSDVRVLPASRGVWALDDLLKSVRLRSFFCSLAGAGFSTLSPSKDGGSITSSDSVVVRMILNSGTSRAAGAGGLAVLASLLMLSFFLNRSLRPFMAAIRRIDRDFARTVQAAGRRTAGLDGVRGGKCWRVEDEG